MAWKRRHLAGAFLCVSDQPFERESRPDTVYNRTVREIYEGN